MSRIFLSETVVLVSVHCCLPQLKVAWSSKYCWLFCFHSENVSCKRDETPRRVIQWLTHDQKITLVKTVCSLRTVRFTTHVQTFHDKRGCKLREYWLLDVIIRLSRLIRAFCLLLQNKFALGKRNMYKFSCKKSTTLCFLQQLFAAWNNLICCKRGLNPGGKTHNITFQFVLQQCCKTKETSLLPVLQFFKHLFHSASFLVVLGEFGCDVTRQLSFAHSHSTN